jgi:hypothetical protein
MNKPPTTDGLSQYQLLLEDLLPFPLYTGVWVRGAGLAVLAMFPLSMLVAALAMSDGMGDRLTAAMLQAFSALSGALAAVLSVMWVVALSAFGLAILRDTAAGNDEVYNWPGPVWLDWMGDALYVFNAAVLSAIAGLGIGWLLGLDIAGTALAASVSLVLFFPVVLLSMLEKDSPLLPVSRPTWRSMAAAPGAWAMFYAFSLGILAVTLVAGWFVWRIGESLSLHLVVMFTISVLLVAVLLIHFRLLGRLALFCSLATRDLDEPEADEPEDEE